MKTLSIKEKLQEMDIDIEDIVLGDFDLIGEYTAKKSRNRDSDLYATVGCFFRPNYERGILMYHLVREHEIGSVLEIGFGRGYSTFCMAKAMSDHGIDGKITTVDPAFSKEFLESLTKVFPRDWFEKINFVQATSAEFYANNSESFDFIYIDGDHRYEAVKNDWENCKSIFNTALLFDDYHLPTKNEKDIDCAKAIDEISDYEKELIIMDRRIFLDDRGFTDEEINYGQVLIMKENEI